MAPDRQVRVMVVDDHEIMRDGLREVLQRTGDYEVVGQAGDGVSAVNIALELKPDVIIMDVMMPLKNGIDACREITEMLPDTKVLILDGFSRGGCRYGGGGRRSDGLPSEILRQGEAPRYGPGGCLAASTEYRATSCEACSRESEDRLNRRRPTVPSRSHSGTWRS